MATGYIYILSNPAFKNLVKIGRSVKDPSEFRVKELYDSGVPQPFKCEYWALVDEHEKAETKIHAILKSSRPNPKREYFELKIPEAISILRNNLLILADKVFWQGPVEPLKRAKSPDYVRETAKEAAEKKPNVRKRHTKELKRVSWEDFISKLRDYEKQYGNLWIQDGYKASDHLGRLGNQVKIVRKLYQDSGIPEDIKSEIQRIGFILDPDEAWMVGYSKAKSLRDGGTYLKGLRRSDLSDFNIAGFLRDQVRAEREGSLDKEKKALLESLGFSFENKVPAREPIFSPAKYEKGYPLLQEYFKKHGHTRVPVKATIGDFKLGRLVADLRVAYKNDGISSSQISDLNKLDFVWDMNEFTYQQGLAEWKLHIAGGGDPKPHQHAVTKSGFAIGSWRNARLAEYKGQRGSMSDERKKELEAEGFIF